MNSFLEASRKFVRAFLVMLLILITVNVFFVFFFGCSEFDEYAGEGYTYSGFISSK